MFHSFTLVGNSIRLEQRLFVENGQTYPFFPYQNVVYGGVLIYLDDGIMILSISVDTINSRNSEDYGVAEKAA